MMELVPLEDYIEYGLVARKALDIKEIAELSDEFYGRLMKGGKLITFGNGGSAADAQHFAAELSGRFIIERKALPAIALTTNTSSMTAIGNDSSFSEVFSRQITGLTNENDFVVGITTSGNSPNVVEALKVARAQGSYTVGLTGKNGGRIKDLVDKCLRVDSDYTPIIQECHVAVLHMICMEVEKKLAAQEKIPN
jgi:D-sedoheptulose 7-phosphate isomerase